MFDAQQGLVGRRMAKTVIFAHNLKVIAISCIILIVIDKLRMRDAGIYGRDKLADC